MALNSQPHFRIPCMVYISVCRHAVQDKGDFKREEVCAITLCAGMTQSGPYFIIHCLFFSDGLRPVRQIMCSKSVK